MSEDNDTFTTSAPAAEYTPMVDAFAEPPKEEKTYSGDESGIREAAEDIAEKRQKELPVIERNYVTHAPGTEDHHKPRPLNETISLERAADDLTRQRNFEAEAIENAAKDATAAEVDLTRLGADLAQQQAEPQQPEQQPDIAPQPVDPGIDPATAELAAELDRSPKLKAALTEEVQRVRQREEGAFAAEQQFTAATQQAYAFAIQSMVAAIPELQGISVEQMPAALQVLKQSNPQRHADAVQHLARVDQLGKAAAAAQQQQQQRVQAHVHQWAKAQDDEVDSYLAKNESPETVRAVKDNLPKVLESYGVSVDEFARAVASTPILRSAPMQKMLYEVAKLHTLRDQAEQKKSVPVPPVMRPGTSQPRSSYADAEVAAAKARFERNPDDVRLAAAYLTAKRNARS